MSITKLPHTRAKAPAPEAQPKPSATVLARRRSAAQRVERILANGGRQIHLLLDTKPTNALAHLMKHSGLPAVRVVSQLLVDAASQLPMQSKTTKRTK